MKARQNLREEKAQFRSYQVQINRDWRFLKGQLIFAGIILVGVIWYFWWIGE